MGRFGPDSAPAGGGRAVFISQRLFCRLHLYTGSAGLYQPQRPLFPPDFFVVQLLSVVLAPIPSNLTAAAGGLLFGTWSAFFLTYGAVTAGSLLVFWLARTLGREFADRVVSRRLSEKYQKVIREKTTVFLALAFLLPYFPDDVLCILAGLTAIPFGRFALLVLVTRPWGLLFASALGGASLTIPLWAMVLIGLAGAAIFVLGMRYGDRLERAILKRLGKE